MDKIFQPGTFLVSIVTFLIMFLIIRQFGFKPIAKMLEQRRKLIQDEIQGAENSNQEAARLLEEQRKLLDQARQDAKNIMESARVRSEEQGRQIIQEAQAEATRILEEGRALIERERAEALNGVFDKVASLTVELTTKLLHNHVSSAVHDELVAEAEKKLGELVC